MTPPDPTEDPPVLRRVPLKPVGSRHGGARARAAAAGYEVPVDRTPVDRLLPVPGPPCWQRPVGRRRPDPNSGPRPRLRGVPL